MKGLLEKIAQVVRHNLLTFVIILIAGILQLMVILPSGSHYCLDSHCGDYYWGVQEHDGIWHVAVAESSFSEIKENPLNPSFSGSYLQGYNILLDYVLRLGDLLGIPSILMYFKILPLAWFMLFTYTLVRFAKNFSKDKYFINLYLILSYFGSSWSFIFTMIKNNNLIDGQASTAMQPILTLTNLQLAFSYIILMWVLMLLRKSQTIQNIFLISLLMFIAWGLKFYTGFLSSLIVGLYCIFEFVRTKNKSFVLTLLCSAFTSIVSIVYIYRPDLSMSATSAFIFQPLALVWPLIESPSSIYYSNYWANAKYTLMSSSQISLRLIGFSLFIGASYILINIGIRVLGFWQLIRMKYSAFHLSITAAVFVGILIPLLFIQRGVWWNVVQFLYIVMFLLAPFTVQFILVQKSISIRIFFIMLLIISAIPYAYDNLKPYFAKGHIYISDNELSALTFLKSQKEGVVYAPLYNVRKRQLMGEVPVLDIRTSNDTSYISAYTGKGMYFQQSGSMLLAVQYDEREKKIKAGTCSIVKDINYVYFSKEDEDIFIKNCILRNKTMKLFYDKNGYKIYQKI